jgi:hypothetical protein
MLRVVTGPFDDVAEVIGQVAALGRYNAALRLWKERWRPVEHLVLSDGEAVALPALCTCERRLNEPHTEATCPYVDPDDWYAAEVARMAERAPA